MTVLIDAIAAEKVVKLTEYWVEVSGGLGGVGWGWVLVVMVGMSMVCGGQRLDPHLS